MSQPVAQFMSQAGYVNYHPAMSTSYQPSTRFVLMKSNNGWSGQSPIQHTVQQNYQVVGTQQGHIQASFQNQASALQSMNPVQQIGGPQAATNMLFAGDRMPQRHVEAY